ncbi:MAG: hypothetical protein COA73_06650 [Candidatus Hydrogenedentota bacterium]|nr:MAG: hypothetical protein COA73_06650 [Candidatus Hydrogenedentota bacterium]
MDREENGRFGKGNPGGPGRHPRSTEVAYMNALMEECDVETWRKIAKLAVEDAKGGDACAREWLGRYLIGAPKESAPNLVSVQLALLSEIDPVLMVYAKK